MKNYELTYLISPELNEEEIKNISEKINSSIKENGGILDELKNPIKKRIEYSIKNKGEAFLIGLNFHIDPGKLSEIENKLKQELCIFRYIILIKKPVGLIEKPRIAKITKDIKVSIKTERPREKKVELKEIEKKLEEILNE